MTITQFLMYLKIQEAANKMKEETVSVIITWAIILKNTIFPTLKEYCGIIPLTLSQGVFYNIHYAFGK